MFISPGPQIGSKGEIQCICSKGTCDVLRSGLRGPKGAKEVLYAHRTWFRTVDRDLFGKRLEELFLTPRASLGGHFLRNGARPRFPGSLARAQTSARTSILTPFWTLFGPLSDPKNREIRRKSRKSGPKNGLFFLEN